MFKFSFKVGFNIMLYATLLLATFGVFGGLRFGEFWYFVCIPAKLQFLRENFKYLSLLILLKYLSVAIALVY